MKIVNKARFITFMAVVIFLIIAGLSVAESKLQYQVADVHTVVAGETMWSICTKYKPSNMDIRDYIYEVCEYNNCSVDLQVGQNIELIK